MQNNEKMNNEFFQKNFSQMNAEEIHNIIKNMFYQVFLIDVDVLNYLVKTNDYGQYVEFKISGYSYKDEDGTIAPNTIDELEEEDLEGEQ